jgi:hypothetical protein
MPEIPFAPGDFVTIKGGTLAFLVKDINYQAETVTVVWEAVSERDGDTYIRKEEYHFKCLQLASKADG